MTCDGRLRATGPRSPTVTGSAGPGPERKIASVVSGSWTGPRLTDGSTQLTRPGPGLVTHQTATQPPTTLSNWRGGSTQTCLYKGNSERCLQVFGGSTAPRWLHTHSEHGPVRDWQHTMQRDQAQNNTLFCEGCLLRLACHEGSDDGFSPLASR